MLRYQTRGPPLGNSLFFSLIAGNDSEGRAQFLGGLPTSPCSGSVTSIDGHTDGVRHSAQQERVVTAQRCRAAVDL